MTAKDTYLVMGALFGASMAGRVLFGLGTRWIGSLRMFRLGLLNQTISLYIWFCVPPILLFLPLPSLRIRTRWNPLHDSACLCGILGNRTSSVVLDIVHVVPGASSFVLIKQFLLRVRWYAIPFILSWFIRQPPKLVPHNCEPKENIQKISYPATRGREPPFRHKLCFGSCLS